SSRRSPRARPRPRSTARSSGPACARRCGTSSTSGFAAGQWCSRSSWRSDGHTPLDRRQAPAGPQARRRPLAERGEGDPRAGGRRVRPGRARGVRSRAAAHRSAQPDGSRRRVARLGRRQVVRVRGLSLPAPPGPAGSGPVPRRLAYAALARGTTVRLGRVGGARMPAPAAAPAKLALEPASARGAETGPEVVAPPVVVEPRYPRGRLAEQGLAWQETFDFGRSGAESFQLPPVGLLKAPPAT